MKAIQTLGGSWTQALRPCAECGAEHHHLTDMADGRSVCIPCWMELPLVHPSNQNEGPT